MIVAVTRASTTLPFGYRTYLNDPWSIFGPVNFHDLILNLNQPTDRLQRTTPTVLLVRLGQSRSRSRSWNRNRVLHGRCGIGRRVRRWEYHLVGVLQLKRNIGCTLPYQDGTFLAVAGLVLQGLDPCRQNRHQILEILHLESVSIPHFIFEMRKATLVSLLSKAPLMLLSLTFSPAINS
jgi:hypothetical protein